MVQLNSLNPEQRDAVQTIRGPLLILAGAGTGKTRVITYRIAFLIGTGVAPENILAVTFTNKAAREMLERVRHLCKRPAGGDKSSRPTICTFHSLCVRILRRHIEKLGYKRGFVIYDESDQLAAVKKILSQTSGAPADAKSVLSWLSRIKNAGDHEEFSAPDAQLAAHLRPRYESMLRACNAVDFDDLILLVLRLFDERPDALAECQEQCRHLLVDEGQDTNAAQFALVRALAARHQNLCVVGDDDQSIYSWRGAQIANLLEMESYFPGMKLIKLEQNYRSTNLILRAANAVIRHNARRTSKQLWSDNGEGKRIQLQTFADEEAEARSLAEMIEFRRVSQRVPWESQAVLFRTNAQARPLETALRQAGIRYRLIGGQSFFDRREVKDAAAYLKLLLQPEDDISLLRVANVPPRGLNDATMQRLLGASQERNSPVFAAMKNPVIQSSFLKPAQTAIVNFVDWIEAARRPLFDPAPLSLSQWGRALLSEIGYWEDLRRSEKNPETAENRVRNAQDLLDNLDHAGDGATPAERLRNFLDEITLDSERFEEQERSGQGVTLITMHSCKGLEFPHVSIVGLEEGLLPHARSKEEGTLDEERRLFYVALTRAMQTLSLSCCLTRKKFGKSAPCHPSSFLNELPEFAVERADEKAKEPVSRDEGRAFFERLRASL